MTRVESKMALLFSSGIDLSVHTYQGRKERRFASLNSQCSNSSSSRRQPSISPTCWRYLLSRTISYQNLLLWWWHPYSLVNFLLKFVSWFSLNKPCYYRRIFCSHRVRDMGFGDVTSLFFDLNSCQITVHCELSLDASHTQDTLWGICRHVHNICCYIRTDYTRTEFRCFLVGNRKAQIVLATVQVTSAISPFGIMLRNS